MPVFAKPLKYGHNLARLAKMSDSCAYTYFVGARSSEGLRILWASVDYDEHYINVRRTNKQKYPRYFI